MYPVYFVFKNEVLNRGTIIYSFFCYPVPAPENITSFFFLRSVKFFSQHFEVLPA